MRYISTRGQAPILGFCDTVLRGLASDGGLYIPENIPFFSEKEITALQGKSYPDLAKILLWPFINGEIEKHVFDKMIQEAYGTFHHLAVCPLVQIAPDEFVLELFYGPTLAFKDVAMQLLSRLLNHILVQKGQRATILGATSGDTGGSAVQAFAGHEAIDLFILFPKGRVSPIQQAQMTRSNAKNIYPIAIEGDFDACQALVKHLFNDQDFRQEAHLSAINSINWARIMAQIVYYFFSALSLGAPARRVSFTIPTGNFGNIFAGFMASKMGLPIERLVIATNENDILARTLKTATYAIAPAIETTSPSMDIQISSNFERLLFEASKRDSAFVRSAMEDLKNTGKFTLPMPLLNTICAQFDAGSCNQKETAQTIRKLYHACGYLADPHTAIGIRVGQQYKTKHTPMIMLGTAHPAKFPKAVEEACGQTPPSPQQLKDLLKEKEHFTILANNAQKLKAFISDKRTK